MLLERAVGGEKSLPAVLADIAHELSSTYNWETRVQNVLFILCSIFPSKITALGIKVRRWQVFYCPNSENASEIEALLLSHYALLTGESAAGAGYDADSERIFKEGIHENKGDLGSYLSLPVVGADHVLGVLHVRTEEKDAYSVDDVSLLAVIASQIGSYLRNVLSRVEADERTKEMAWLRTEAEQKTAQFESFITSMADGVALFDVDGRNVLLNNAGLAILGENPGWTLDEWNKQYQRVTLDGNLLPAEQSASSRALRGEIIRDYRYKIISPKGKETILSVSASPVRDAQSNIIGATVIFRDVTTETEFHRARKDLYDREHRIAAMLQQALQPPEVPCYAPDFTIAARYQPALPESEVGGDFYDFFSLENGKFGILIGDVIGKGLLAAIHVAATRYTIRSYALLEPSPARVITHANEVLSKVEQGESHIASVFYAVVDPGQGTLTYSNAGHPPPVVCSADGRVKELELIGGMMLGVISGVNYGERLLKVHPGEKIILYTDGISEARQDSSNLFDLQGIMDYLSRNGQAEPESIASGLLAAATDFAGGGLQDDAAIIVLQRKSPSF